MRAVDVAVVGSGAAGLYAAAAARAAAPELRVALFTREPLGGGSTALVHAFSAAVGPGDSVERHWRDTVAAAAGVGDPRLARVLAEKAPARLRELEAWGCRFDRLPGGGYALASYGGHGAPRGARARALGREIARALSRRLEGVEVALGWRLTDLTLAADGGVGGVELLESRSGRRRRVAARAVVLATGGGTAMYARCSAPRSKACAGIAAAARAGARLRDMEMVQFHPTGLALPGHASDGLLVPERLREDGAVVVDARGRRVLGAGAPRDAAAFAVARAAREGGAWLDLRPLAGRAARSAAAALGPELARRARAFGGRLPVAPTAHSLLGGVAIDVRAATSVPGLFACGEDAGGVHGASRLAGNGLAEALVFGEISGRAAAEHAAAARAPRPPRGPRAGAGGGRRAADPAGMTARLRAAMDAGAGVEKTRSGLARLGAELAALEAEFGASRPPRGGLGAWLDLRDLLRASALIQEAASRRSRDAGCFRKSA